MKPTKFVLRLGVFASVIAGVLASSVAPARAAASHRVALVVGANAGAAGRKALRFAESDATKLVRVLVDLGGFSVDDVYLFRGRDAAAIMSGFDAVTRKVAGWKAADPSARVEFVFFFSGHSDGQALELGATPLEFAELRRRTLGTGADLRVLVVDSCNSGALLASKGGQPGRGFEITLTETLTSRGEALLTSSARDEVALESTELRGSFFSHHFISALRGVGDANGDGRVTLNEAYQHAYARTLSETSASIYGGQHANYDYRVSGHGDLMLTQVSGNTSTVELPTAFERLMIASARDVLLETRAGHAQTVALPAGTYWAKGWQGGRPRSMSFALGPGENRKLSAGEFTEEAVLVSYGKGGALAAAVQGQADAAGEPLSLGLSAGLATPSAAQSLGWGIRGTVGLDRVRGAFVYGAFSAATEGSSPARQQFLAGLGYRLGWSGLLDSRRLVLAVEAGLEGGVTRATEPTGTTRAGILAAIWPGVRTTWTVSPRFALSASGEVQRALIGGLGERSSGGFTPRFWLSAELITR